MRTCGTLIYLKHVNSLYETEQKNTPRENKIRSHAILYNPPKKNASGSRFSERLVGFVLSLSCGSWRGTVPEMNSDTDGARRQHDARFRSDVS